MKIIVGLGNIGEEYGRSRHNVGFLALDRWIGGDNFVFEKKFDGFLAKTGENVYLKPTTMMNESGRSVAKYLSFFRFSKEDLVLVHDDLDIAFGEYKIQKGKGPKVHNGVRSVERETGSEDFWRVRIGVDNREPGGSYGTGADYVLSNFSKDEMAVLDKLFEEIFKELAETVGLKIK